jgi:tRNA threonylcarbamoyladenosine biosynthesis protein TsaB
LSETQPLEEGAVSSQISVSANKMPLILSLETATRAGSVAVTRGETVLAASVGDAAISHSALLLSDIGEVLEKAGLSLGEIDCFAAATGPGSFTGLRIGLATVKSFAATMARPCVGVPTLHAVAHAAGQSRRTLAVLPAGRGEVYAQLFEVDEEGNVHPLDAPSHLPPETLLARVRTVPSPLVWAGDGVSLYVEFIRARALDYQITLSDESEAGRQEESGKRQWILASATQALAISVAQLALLRMRAGRVETPEQLQAIYVRPADAELKRVND